MLKTGSGETDVQTLKRPGRSGETEALLFNIKECVLWKRYSKYWKATQERLRKK